VLVGHWFFRRADSRLCGEKREALRFGQTGRDDLNQKGLHSHFQVVLDAAQKLDGFRIARLGLEVNLNLDD
jgi:hypothetical protein